MFDCSTDRYDELYAPWLAKADTLLVEGGYKPGEHLLDLCGGTGAVSKAALAMNPDRYTWMARTELLDINPRHPDMFVVNAKAEDVAAYYPANSFHIVVCRQAMAYLDPEKVIPAVASILKPEGRFVFNTFQRPKRFRFRSEGEFIDGHVYLFGRVFHLQVKRGAGWDVSIFKYIPSARMLKLLLPYFEVVQEERGPGIHWLCRRRSEI